jgi:hypothetical protein
MAAEFDCIRIPSLNDIPEVKFLGATLKGIADFSATVPTDCSVSFSLLAQLSSALSSIDCIIKLLNFVTAVKNTLSSFPPNIGKLATALKELAECIAAISPASFIFTIRGIIRLIIQILTCLADELEHIIDFRAGIDLNAAIDNPKLGAILQCAQSNADDSAKTVLQTLQQLKAVLDVVSGLPGFEGAIPDVSNLSVNVDLGVNVEGIRDLIRALEPLAGTIEVTV